MNDDSQHSGEELPPCLGRTVRFIDGRSLYHLYPRNLTLEERLQIIRKGLWEKHLGRCPEHCEFELVPRSFVKRFPQTDDTTRYLYHTKDWEQAKIERKPVKKAHPHESSVLSGLDSSGGICMRGSSSVVSMRLVYV